MNGATRITSLTTSHLSLQQKDWSANSQLKCTQVYFMLSNCLCQITILTSLFQRLALTQYLQSILSLDQQKQRFVIKTGLTLVRPLFAAPRLSSKNMSNFMFKFLISQLTDFFIFSLSFQAKFNLQSTTFDDKLLHEKGRKDFLKKIKKTCKC